LIESLGVGPNDLWQASAADGRLRLIGAETNKFKISSPQLRASIDSLSGSLVVESESIRSKDTIAVAAPAQEHRELVLRIKRELDPADIFFPGHLTA
jgi:FAD/FMN-containing dehydrogenase